jgi:hypothetical protein
VNRACADIPPQPPVDFSFLVFYFVSLSQLNIFRDYFFFFVPSRI